MRQNLSVEEALEAVLGFASPLESEPVPLLQSYGRILAQDLASPIFHPDADDSAVDGYACLANDTLGASAQTPVRLEVIGQAPAGRPFAGKIQTGQAVQIFTGAPLPSGADAVIRVEETRREGSGVLLLAPALSTDIRRKGDDLKAGQVYLRRGEALTAGRVGLAAAMGYTQLEVFRKPRVGILSTGDEVVEPGQPLPLGGVYNSNSYSVAGMVLQAGAEPVMLGRVSDNPEALQAQLHSADRLDLLLTTGGVSMGEYDFVRKLLEQSGQIHFWKVKIQPGGPFLFAHYKGTPLMGLPGNPVSAMVTFLLFGRPFLSGLLGRSDAPYSRIKAICVSPFTSNPSKRVYRRAVLSWQQDGYTVASTGNQSSVVLNSMAAGNCLVVLEAGVRANPGDAVDVIPLP